MARSLGASAAGAARDAVPFLVITVIWIVVMLVVYGLFLATKPGTVSYGPAIHASVFVPPLVGFVGHTVHQIRKG
jgi:hypothetical protein